MAAHRYWRATAFEAYGEGDMELSEFHLLASGARVDATATLTASAAPDLSGALANLQDDVLATSARWSAQSVKGLVLQWDFAGSTADVTDIRLAGDSSARFPLVIKLQYSDDATAWGEYTTYLWITWPGPGKKTISELARSFDPHFSNRSLLLHFDGVNGSTTFTDSSPSPKTVTGYGGVSISTATSVFGGASCYNDGTGGHLKIPSSEALNFGSGDFAIRCRLFLASVPGASRRVFQSRDGDVVPGVYLSSASDGRLQLYLSTDGTSFTHGPINFSVATAEWTDIDISRYGDTCTVRVNGILAGSMSVSGAIYYNASDTWVIGGQTSPNRSLHSYMDEFTVVKGGVEFASDFIPPASGYAYFVTSVARNALAGRVSPSECVSVGAGPAITYGTPHIALPPYLSVESGSIKDQLTGVLGQGIGRVVGTVATVGSPNQPVHRRVRLVRDRDGLVIRELWSDPVTGAYDFRYVDERQAWTVVSYDHLNNYRAVVADNLTLANGGVELL